MFFSFWYHRLYLLFQANPRPTPVPPLLRPHFTYASFALFSKLLIFFIIIIIIMLGEWTYKKKKRKARTVMNVAALYCTLVYYCVSASFFFFFIFALLFAHSASLCCCYMQYLLYTFRWWCNICFVWCLFICFSRARQENTCSFTHTHTHTDTELRHYPIHIRIYTKYTIHTATAAYICLFVLCALVHHDFIFCI